RPVEVAGRARVVRLPATRRERERLVYEAVLPTGADGRAIFRWTPLNGGHFRAEFIAPDRDGKSVRASLPFWVRGPELDEYPLTGSALLVERPDYRAGQTAKALLTLPAPGCNVLLLWAADGEILRR